MAAAGSFDGPIGIIAATIMARTDSAEAEAVAELASGPGDDALVAGFGPAIGLYLLAGRPVPENRTQVTSAPSASRSGCAGPAGTP